MTKKLYYEDSYLLEFEAKVISETKVDDHSYVILDRTCFYPSSGGQPADHGWINGMEVLDVTIKDGSIIHNINGTLDDFNVKGKIDWKRRQDHMQQHTGQHILSQVILRTLGKDSESLHIGNRISSIDIPIKKLERRDIEKIEEDTNNIIFSNIPIFSYFVSSTENGDYRKKSELKGDIRIVEIDKFDKTPCGGTHLKNTSEVGLLKITNYYKKGAFWRIEFVCGNRCLKIMRNQGEIITQVGNQLMVPQEKIYQTILKNKDNEKALQKSLAELVHRIATLELERLLIDATEISNLKIIKTKLQDPKLANDIAKMIPSQKKLVSLLGCATDKGANLYFSSSSDSDVDVSKILKDVLDVINGRGGGSARFASGFGNDPEKLDEALELAFRALERN